MEIIKWVKGIVARYSWWILRWALNLKNQENGYVWAYMAHPHGYNIHDRETIENELGFKAEVVVFRRDDIPDPRKAGEIPEKRAMHPGGYL